MVANKTCSKSNKNREKSGHLLWFCMTFLHFYGLVWAIFGLAWLFMAKYWSDWTCIVFPRGHRYVYLNSFCLISLNFEKPHPSSDILWSSKCKVLWLAKLFPLKTFKQNKILKVARLKYFNSSFLCLPFRSSLHDTAQSFSLTKPLNVQNALATKCKEYSNWC